MITMSLVGGAELRLERRLGLGRDWGLGLGWDWGLGWRLRLRAMQTPATSHLDRALHRLQDRPNSVRGGSGFFHDQHPPSVRFVFLAGMLSAIEPAKLLLLGHCDGSFQTFRPHNPNRPPGWETCG